MINLKAFYKLAEQLEAGEILQGISCVLKILELDKENNFSML